MSAVIEIKARQNIPKCGEIWMCNLCGKEGSSVQAGYRPVFVLSNDKNNRFSPTLNVVPLTSRVNKNHLPVHVPLLNYWNYGLCKPSTMLVEQITTIPADRLDVRIGEIKDSETLNRIYHAIGVQFPIIAMFAV